MRKKLVVLCLAVLTMLLFVVLDSVLAGDKVVVIPLMVGGEDGIPPEDVFETKTYWCAPNTNCLMKTVPDRKYLVITSLSLQPSNPGTGTINGTVTEKKATDQYATIRIYWTITNGWGEMMQFTPGIVVDSENLLSFNNSNTSDAAVNAQIFGYLIDK